jgi:hypothetical protein
MPGGSCSLSVQVIPLSYDRFMHPLHLRFIKPKMSRGIKINLKYEKCELLIRYTFLQSAK